MEHKLCSSTQSFNHTTENISKSMPTMNVNEFSVDDYITDVIAEYLHGFPSVDECDTDVMAEYLLGFPSVDDGVIPLLCRR